ncbi:MAG: DinB family protein [Acidobacteria bacterium]|nr:DinB family protein [Acidobacteriota bacterium]
MRPELAAIVGELETAQARLARLAAATPGERWSERHDPNRWSIAECVAHLNLTSRAFEPLIVAALRDARSLGRPARRRYRQDAVGWLVGRVVGPMPAALRRLAAGRVRAPAPFVPQGALPRGEVLTEFETHQARQIALTGEAEGLPIDEVWILSPFDGRVRYTLFSTLVILARHQHRHLQQAEEVW